MKDRSVIGQLDSGETVRLQPVRREDNARYAPESRPRQIVRGICAS
jgi:hypothetical protein